MDILPQSRLDCNGVFAIKAYMIVMRGSEKETGNEGRFIKKKTTSTVKKNENGGIDDGRENNLE